MGSATSTGAMFVYTLHGVGKCELHKHRSTVARLVDANADPSASITVSTTINGKPAEVVFQRKGGLANVVVTRGRMRSEFQEPLF